MFVNSSQAGILIGGEITLGRAWHDKQVYREENKLFYITKGELILRVDGEEVLCGAGELVLVPARLCHDYYLSSLETCHKYWLHFKMEKGGVCPLTDMRAPLHVAVPERDRKRMEASFDYLVKGDEPFSAYKKLGLLYELVAYFLEKADAALVSKGAHEFEALTEYIHKNLDKDLSLAALSKQACLSAGYLARRFKTVMGVSPLKYVLMARMERAREMLAVEKKSVGEVMKEVGFSDHAYFSKSFKHYNGYPPSVYQRLAK